MLCHRGKHVEGEFVGVGSVQGPKRDVTLQQRCDNGDLPSKPIKLRYNKRRAVQPTEGECSGKLWTSGIAPALNLNKLGDYWMSGSLGMRLHSSALRLKA